MSEPITTYHSYMVRLWQDSPHGPWRAQAHCVQTRAIVHFADLHALFAFLWTEAGHVPTTVVEVCEDLTQPFNPGVEK